MVQALKYFKETASQTSGPYVHIGLAPGAAGFDIYQQELGHDIAGPQAKGARISVTGVVRDGTGTVIKDLLFEVWQANADGIYPGKGEVEDGFRGWGRVTPNFDTGVYTFETIKPGPATGRNGGLIAPHLNLWLVARGINVGLNTRMYFEDEDTANATDPVLNLIEQPHRRDTLIARADGATYHFDICLQGDGETVFFDI